MSHPIPNGQTANATRATVRHHDGLTTRSSPRTIDCTPTPDTPAARSAATRGRRVPDTGAAIERADAPDHPRSR